MPNILGYLHEQGAKSFGKLAFNEVDNLILSQLVYLELDGIVPSRSTSDYVTVEDAWAAYASRHSAHELYECEGFNYLTPFVLQAMAESRRYASVRLAAWEQRLDPAAHEQFAAMCALLPDRSAYVAFRGTDSTLAGWREDFMLSYEVVPAQRDAAAYLDSLGRRSRARLRVGGHSKGGNLSAYAAAFCADDVRSRVIEVWCNDSPGFERKVVDWQRLESIAERMRLLVPEFRVVGSLMEHPVQAEAVRVDTPSIVAHATHTWQVEGASLARADGLSAEGERMAALFDKLIEGRDLAGREAFVSDVFDALEATGATDVNELFGRGPAAVEEVIGHLAGYDPSTQGTLRDLLLSLVAEVVGASVLPAFAPIGEALGSRRQPTERVRTGSSGISVDEMRRHRARRSRREGRLIPLRILSSIRSSRWLTDAVLLVMGILIIANADAHVPVLGYAAVLLAGSYSAWMLSRYVSAVRSSDDADLEDLAIGLVTAVPVVAMLVFRVSVAVLYNLVLGIALLYRGILDAREGRVTDLVCEPVRLLREPRAFLAVAEISAGMLLLVNPSQLGPWSHLLAGIVIAAYGLWGLISRR